MPPPKFKNEREQRRYSSALVDLYVKRMEEVTQDMLDEKITLLDWQIEMKKLLRQANKEQFITARATDPDNIFVGDYGILGSELKKQYRFLKNFSRQIKAAEPDDPLNWVMGRARMYARSTRSSFWRSTIEVDLPQVPGDGKTKCRTNCQCDLDKEYEYDDAGNLVAVLVYWRTNASESCPDCLELEREWSPLRVMVNQN